MCQKALEILAALDREAAKKKNQKEDAKKEEVVKKVFK